MIKLIYENKPKYIKPLKTGKAVWEVLAQQEKLVAEIIFVSPEEIRQLNLENRNIDKVTDVLSFPTLDNIRGKILQKKDYPLDYDFQYNGIFIGSVVICSSVADGQAKEYNHSKEREYTFLLVHSLLHLMGYDHIEETDRVQMRKLEDIIMKKLNLEVDR